MMTIRTTSLYKSWILKNDKIVLQWIIFIKGLRSGERENLNLNKKENNDSLYLFLENRSHKMKD